MLHILEITLNNELDVLAARQRTRQIAAVCGFTLHEQTRLSTAVSELARRATSEDRPGHVALDLSEGEERQMFVITVLDRVSYLKSSNVINSEAAHEFIAKAAGQPSVRHFLDSVEFNVTSDGAMIMLSKARPLAAPYLDLADIESAVIQLTPLPSHVAASAAGRQAREAKIENDSLSSENRHLHQQTDLLVSADQRKDEFLAILAHELRGPLSAVAMAAQILAKGTLSPTQAVNFGQLISRQAGHMNRIVEDLLDVSRIVRNEVSIENELVDLREVISSAAEQIAPAAQRRNHEVVLRQPEVGVYVLGDRTRLVQVVGNLMGNSVRYTPEGGNIEVALTAQLSQICISVSDDGIGISAELLPSLFDMFKQAERSTDGRNSGLGLGLALVKTLVEAHHGTISGSSDGPGCGSRFEVRLPRAIALTTS
jgi:signal transduction histidine kinase